MKIREYRERLGLTSKELAQKMGVDATTVSAWESGRILPRAAKLPLMADLFGCTIDALYGREPPTLPHGEAAS